MRLVKTWLRSHTTSDRLSDLCRLYCHHERVDEEKTIEYWQPWLVKSDGELISERDQLEVKLIQL